MDSECSVCQHNKIGAIDASLAIGLTPAVIAGKYHIAKKLIELHQEHRSTTRAPQALTDRSIADEAIGASFCEVCAARPLIRFRGAWQDAKDDPQELASMVAWIQEQLRQDDMGLDWGA